MARVGLYTAGLVTIVVWAARPLVASGPSVPEIDGGSIPAALGVLSAGILMLRARRQSK